MKMTRVVFLSAAFVAAVALLGSAYAVFAADASATPPVADSLVNNLGTAVLAIGALGTAAFGVVDGLKFIPWIDLAGFERLFSRRVSTQGRRWPMTIRANLDPLVRPLALAYGADVMEVLKAQYRSARSKGDLPRTLRQGVRIGIGFMSADEIEELARDLGLPEATARTAGRALVATRDLRPPALGQTTPPAATITDDDRAAMARLETAIDARIDAALVLAETLYVTQTKVIASVVAIGIALAVGHLLKTQWEVSLVVGLAAVPLAPVAHDAATALEEAVKALKAVRSR
jgi:hypothetical protein